MKYLLGNEEYRFSRYENLYKKNCSPEGSHFSKKRRNILLFAVLSIKSSL
ncbi:MAG: hypothetical protein ACRCTQ_03575 [Brevinemataceae bacterium]